jgi:RNA polymerase sigma-70 factor (ECF subfamily)
MEDVTVIQRVKDGDIEAFSLLVEKYHRRLLTFISRLINDRDRAEDIGQDVFLSVYKSLNSFDESEGTPFSAWLFIAARNRCVSELRFRKNKETLPIENAFDISTGAKAIDEVLIEQERLKIIKESLVQLPERFRNAIMGSLRGESLDDIAKKEGTSIGTVKSRLFRAREMMKGLVKRYIGGTSYEGV